MTEDRRRGERRGEGRISDLTLPELRRILVTTALTVVVLLLFLWMVRTVIVAGVLGAVIGVYLRPLHERLRRTFGSRGLAAVAALAIVILPLLAALAYSYAEIREVVSYLEAHQGEVAAAIQRAARRLPFPLANPADLDDDIGRWVLAASHYGAELPGMVRRALGGFAVATSIFLFTAFYVLTDAAAISAYVRGKIPPRYSELVGSLETNVRGVLYGAIYSTLVTQALKSVVLLALNLAFGVPLAAVLALLSFVIGFFPIVGSWSVYVPVALWLWIFRDAPVPAAVMFLTGFFVNTLFMSMYLRPKLAAERSRVLNFYWMLVGLVTGVYTFGLAGILLGPILIGLLKAIIDTVTATTSWRLLGAAEGDVAPAVPGETK